MSGFDEASVDQNLLNSILNENEQDPAAEKDEANDSNLQDFDATEDIVREEAKQQMAKERRNGTVTVIAHGTKINNGISTEGSLEVMGVITGDIECQGKVSINGEVSGNVNAKDIYVNTKRLGGDLNSSGTVKIGGGTIMIGNITGSSAYIAGAVEGKIDVNGPVVIDATAIVKGDIEAKSIQVNSGAVVEGHCSLKYAEVDLDSFFKEK